MRYNPPPNWPKPPKGWAPHADWSPDPAWPPPPPGWRLWVEEDAPDAKSALGGLKQAGDDGEYFGDENAWAEDSGPAPAGDELDAVVSALPPQPTEVAPEDLAVQHLGQYATVKWDDEQAVRHRHNRRRLCRCRGGAPHARRHRRADCLSARDAGRGPRLLVWI